MLRANIFAALMLGGLSLAAIVLNHLALTDIYHGEPNATLEWQIVRYGHLIFLLFAIVAMIALVRVLPRVRAPH